MTEFITKVFEIFSEYPELGRHVADVIWEINHISPRKFEKIIDRDDETSMAKMIQVYDVLFVDYYFKEIDSLFLNWVIENFPNRFTKEEFQEMKAQAKAYLDFFEVQNVEAGKGSFLKSLMTGEQFFVNDVSSSYGLHKWDIVLTRRYSLNDQHFITGTLEIFPYTKKEFILTSLKEVFDEFQEETGSTDYGLFAKENWPIFFEIVRDIRKEEENKKIYTKYGELQFCEVRFDVKNLLYILKKAESLDEFLLTGTKLRKFGKKRTVKRYDFDWISLGLEKELKKIEKSGQPGGFLHSTRMVNEKGEFNNAELLGNFHVDRILGRLEVRSLELAEFAIEHFKEIFGDSLKFKRIDKKKIDFKKLKEKAMEERQSEYEYEDEDENEDKVDPKLKQKVQENLYLEILNQKVPALNNLTPKEAAKNPEMRHELIEWVKGLVYFLIRDENINEKEIIRIFEKELNIKL